MKSFSGFKKEINNFICDDLKDRIDFRFSVYRNHEFKTGKIKIMVDNAELLEINDVIKGYYMYNRESFKDYDRESKILQKNFIEYGFYDTREFYKFMKKFLNMDIQSAIHSDNPLIQLFAIIDRRIGKRSLEKIDISRKPEFIKIIYDERMKSYKFN